MKEVEYQTLIVKSVRMANGFAIKMSNRFLIGIPDLLIHLPGYMTSLWEVKRDPEPKYGKPMKLKLTPPQRYILDNYHNAGGICGVISILEGKQQIHFGVFDLEKIDKGIYANQTHYTVLQRGQRSKNIVDILKRHHDQYRGTTGEPTVEPWGLRPSGKLNTVYEELLATGSGTELNGLED